MTASPRLPALAALALLVASPLACDGPPPPGPGGYGYHGVLPPIDPGGGVYVDPDRPPPSAAPPRCRDAWAALPGAARRYDHEADAGLEGYARYHQRLRRGECRKRWTVLLYMAADVGDLAPFALWNLLDMETPRADGSAASNDEADVVAQLDLPGAGGLRRLHVLPRDRPAPATVNHESLRGADIELLRSPTAWQRAREDQDPGASLRAFLEWGRARYPAEHTMLILWGHGAGWRGANGNGRLVRPCPARPDGSLDFLGDGGFGPDCSERTVLDIPTIRAAALASGGVDVLVTDACLLQTVEITTELADAARYVVGYEQVSPHAGLPYRELIPRINGELPARRRGCAQRDAARCSPGDVACALAAAMPDLYCGAVADGYFVARARGTNDTPADRTFTISAVDTQLLTRELVPALDELGDALVPYLDEDPFRGIDLFELLKPGGLPGFEGETRDLDRLLVGLVGALATAASQEPSTAVTRAREAAVEARRALDRAVLSAAWGSGYPTPPGLGGLSIWLPKCKTSLRAKREEFARSRFYAALREGADEPAWPERQPSVEPSSDEHPWDEWIAAVLEPQPDCR